MGLLDTLFGSSGSQSQTSAKILAPEGEFERQGRELGQAELGTLTDWIRNSGLGQADVQGGVQGQRDLAQMLAGMVESGGLPSEAQFGQARSFANQALMPQEVAIRQAQEQEQLQANQLAARLGRSTGDPLIQARVAQQRQRQEEMLGAQRSALSAQTAQQLPMQQLGLAQQLAQVRGGLASQALANRQFLLSSGRAIQEGDRQFRLNTATTRTTQEQRSTPSLMTGLAGAAAGIGGLATGLGSVGGLAGLGSSLYSNTLGAQGIGALFSGNKGVPETNLSTMNQRGPNTGFDYGSIA